MRKSFLILLGATVCAVVSAAQPIQEAFQKGLFEEEANQNLPAAIKAYESVLDQMELQRRIAATTVFRLGECYRKLNKTNEAVASYQRVLREFPDQAALNTIARQNLAALGAGAPAAPAVPARPVANREQDPGTSAEALELAQLKEMLRHSPDLLNASFEPAKPSPLKNAVTKGYVSVVEFLLKSGVDVSLKDSGGATALHHAAKQGHLTITEMLIAAGSDLQARDQHGWSPLHSAAYNGHRAIVELLTDAAALNAARARHQTRSGKTEASPSPPAAVDLNSADEDRSTPLHLAAARGFAAVVNLLLSRGAQVDSRDHLGQTPLHWAVVNNQSAVIQTLASKGADVNTRITGIVRPSNEAGDLAEATALHLATKFKPLVDLLLSLKADSNARASDSRTPLDVAIRSRQWQSALRLVEAGTELNPADSVAGSPLWWVINVSGGPPDKRAETAVLLEAIVSRKPDVNRAHEGRTPLQMAVEAGFTSAVKRLLEAGADPNLKTPQHPPPLHLAIQHNKWPEAELLLKHKADPNLKDSNGSTPLHYAVRLLRKELAELLIANGADVNARNQDGLTPLEHLLNPATSSDRFPPATSTQPLPFRAPISPAQLDMSRLLIRNGAQGKRPYGPEQATGEPMAGGGLTIGSSSFSWKPHASRSGQEWLALEYDKPAKLARLEIRHSSAPGVLRKVTVLDESGDETTIWEGIQQEVQFSQGPHAGSYQLIRPNLPVESEHKLLTKKVKLHFSIVQGVKAPEVDAAELIGADGTRQWASKATASSSAADPQ